MGAWLRGAGADRAGGRAVAGLGAGMGLAVAGRMMPGLVPGATPPAPPPPPAPPAWHLVQNGQATGPFTMEQLARFAEAGALRTDTLVWTAGMAGWSAASQVPQVAPLVTPPSAR